jgi:hypothetical protein
MNLVIGCFSSTTYDTLDGDRPGRELCFHPGLHIPILLEFGTTLEVTSRTWLKETFLRGCYAPHSSWRKASTTALRHTKIYEGSASTPLAASSVYAKVCWIDKRG